MTFLVLALHIDFVTLSTHAMFSECQFGADGLGWCFFYVTFHLLPISRIVCMYSTGCFLLKVNEPKCEKKL